ncbi:hypothetical protein CVT24_008661 [Panaeolus cyanescens]|uniref:Uncharacterized protein n=1 Tax=Panaeolus cyanescens TaxID=181874 RepID=A0A409VBD1_9AGAR|nr:hypothetical protein CVT24_008661 [Panaeolus cyanescens]
MLARLTMLTTSPRIFDLHIQPIGLSADESEHTSTLILDLDALRQAFLPSIPDNPWNRVAGVCGRAIAPVCSTIQSTISNDIDTIAQILYRLELNNDAEQSLGDILPVGLLEPISSEDEVLSSPPKSPEVGSSSDSSQNYKTSCHSIPSIVITPAPPQKRETSCLVPYQDEAFGNQLTVPLHPAFNTRRHPPMQHLQHTPLPRLDNWKWVNGRWKAIIPSLEEQNRRGMFSKARGIRRKGPRTSKKQAAQSL